MLRNSDFWRWGDGGVRKGRREMGGAPNVTQWIRLKRVVRAFNSESVALDVESM